MASIPIPKRLGAILLGVWLILTGLVQIGSGFAIPGWIMGVLAIAAGVLFILER